MPQKKYMGQSHQKYTQTISKWDFVNAIKMVGLYIVPDLRYDKYHDTLQPIVDMYHDTNFSIF